jgi:hypothetical protein
VVIILLWFASISFTHLVCRLLQGKGRYVETLSVMIQVYAVIYVLTSFLALVAVMVMTLPPVARQVNMVPFVGQFLVDDPGYVFFLISTVLLMVYGSLALRSVHRFGWIRTTITALLPLSSLPVSIILYYIKHIMSFK